eukprot:759721-Hanusia_phi.AAC.1
MLNVFLLLPSPPRSPSLSLPTLSPRFCPPCSPLATVFLSLLPLFVPYPLLHFSLAYSLLSSPPASTSPHTPFPALPLPLPPLIFSSLPSPCFYLPSYSLPCPPLASTSPHTLFPTLPLLLPPLISVPGSCLRQAQERTAGARGVQEQVGLPSPPLLPPLYPSLSSFPSRLYPPLFSSPFLSVAPCSLLHLLSIGRCYLMRSLFVLNLSGADEMIEKVRQRRSREGGSSGKVEEEEENNAARAGLWSRRDELRGCLLYTSPSPRDRTRS